MQLCLQAVAELAVQGASTVDMRFSYPTAFNDQDRARFESIWGNIVTDLNAATGIDVQLNRKVDNREAIAATRFFASPASGERIDVSGGALTIDIGGGTTDVAVWNSATLMSHSSIYFAGRDIFLIPLRRKPEILPMISSGISLDELKRHKDSAFNAQLDNIVSHYGDVLIRALPVKEADQRVKDLLGIIELGLCGVAFYSGLLVARLLEGNNTYRLGRHIPIFVGGNGSKLFQWCALGSFSERSEIHSRFANSFMAGAKLGKHPEPSEEQQAAQSKARPNVALKDVRVEIFLSRKPKSEVAYGLVARDINLQIDDSFTKPLAGENYIVETEDNAGKRVEVEKQWNDSPAVDEIRTSSVLVDRNFPTFRKFLESVGEQVDEDALYRIGGDVNGHFRQLAQSVQELFQENPKAKGEHLLRNEPVFIVALKRLLEIKVDGWARRV